jgi:hypothetical protein
MLEEQLLATTAKPSAVIQRQHANYFNVYFHASTRASHLGHAAWPEVQAQKSRQQPPRSKTNLKLGIRRYSALNVTPDVVSRQLSIQRGLSVEDGTQEWSHRIRSHNHSLVSRAVMKTSELISRLQSQQQHMHMGLRNESG